MKLNHDIPVPRLSHHFDIENPVPSAKLLLEFFRPELHPYLESHKLIVKSLTGGVNNHLLLVHFLNDAKVSHETIIRVNGEETGSMIDREAEVRMLLTLNRYDCYGKVYGVFDNGMCYEYVPGKTLALESIRDDHITRLILAEMVKLHSIHGNKGIEKSMDIFDKMHSVLEGIPTFYNDHNKDLQFREYFPNFHSLFSDEINLLKRHLTEGNLHPPKVFCHNDLHYNNILYDATKDSVQFIDFEFAGINYQAYDLANYFNEFSGFFECDFSRYPDAKTQIPWLRYYLECWDKAHGLGDKTAVTDRRVRELFVLVNKFSLVSHLFWVLWSLCQAQSSVIDFNYLRYGKERFEEYSKRKRLILDLSV